MPGVTIAIAAARLTVDVCAGVCTSCTLLIALFGFTDATYVITFSTGPAMTRLIDGVCAGRIHGRVGTALLCLAGMPQQGAATLGTYSYYSFAVDALDADLSVTVTPYSGMSL